jgi:hypothetical protein
MSVGRNDLKDRWATLHLFPTRAERVLARFWPASVFLLFSPLLFVPWLAPRTPLGRFELTEKMLSVGFVASLLVACVLGAVAFAVWESTFRQTFGNALEDGLVRNDPDSVAEYMTLSEDISNIMASPWRYLLWLTIVSFVAFVNRGPLIAVIHYLRNVDPIARETFLEDISILSVQFLMKYVGAAISWALISSAIWMSRFSKSYCLQLQPGHSDNCCGLADVGLCSLQSAVPLLVGMLLLFLWSYGDRVRWFASHVNMDFLAFVRTYVFALLLALFALVCALVFLPLVSLHRRMRDYKRGRDKEYSELIRTQCELSRDALANGGEPAIKYLAERLKVVQIFDPVTLKLSTWPFDRIALITYGLTPAFTLLAPLVKTFISR